MQHLRSAARKREHLVIGHGVVFDRIREFTRVGGVYAVHVRVDAAAVGVQQRRQRNCRGIRAAAPEGRHVSLGIDPLKARDQDNVPRLQFPDDAVALQAKHPRAAVDTLRQKSRLPAAQADRPQPQPVQRHRAEAHRADLARGQELIQLAPAAVRVNLPRPCDQRVGGCPLCGQDGHDLVPFAAQRGHRAGGGIEPLGIRNGSPAIFQHISRQSFSSFPAWRTMPRAIVCRFLFFRHDFYLLFSRGVVN